MGAGGRARMGGGPWRGLGQLALALALAGALAALGAAAALADQTVCEEGAGAGQCKPRGTATDWESGRLYVADKGNTLGDKGNNRIDVFELDEGEEAVQFAFAFGWGVRDGSPEAQTCGPKASPPSATCEAGIPGSGEGQFGGSLSIAVDNDPASADHHAVYVHNNGEIGNRRVQKFDPEGNFLKQRGGFGPTTFGFGGGAALAVGPGGVLFVGDLAGDAEDNPEPRLKRFDGELEPVGECELPQPSRPAGLAVDSTGRIYAKLGGLYEFEADCSPVREIDAGLFNSTIALDEADNLYVGQSVAAAGEGSSYRVVTKLDSAGTHLRRYGFRTLGSPPIGLAWLQSGFGDVFAAEPGSVKYLAEPPPGPLIAALRAEPGNVRTTLEAEIDPEGEATTYRFEYLSEQAYQEQGESFAGPATKETAPASLDGGAADFDLHLASEEVGCPEPLTEAEEPESKCLTPETAYRYRALAENPSGEGEGPSQGSFTTQAPLAIEDTWASEVGSESARLSVKVNPLGIPASGWLEYVTEAEWEQSGYAGAARVPAAGEIDFGAGEAGAVRSAVVALAPGTAYRFRAQARNPLIEPLVGEEVLFSTLVPEGPPETDCPNRAFRTGLSAFLADCRAYELVSPLDKEDGDIVVQKEDPFLLAAVLSQSSAQGDKLVYGSSRAFGDAEAAPYTAQYLAERGAEAWASHYALGPREELTTLAAKTLESELKALSADLCQGWLKTAAEPALAPGAVAGRPNLYRRADQSCGGETYEAITTAEPQQDPGTLEPQGASADGTKAIYATRDNLTAEAPDLKGNGLALYYQEAGEGAPRYVCVGPAGQPIAESCAAGTTVDVSGRGRTASLANAISADGERVFWSTPAGEKKPGKIFLRVHPGRPESARLHGKAAGAGDLIGPAAGTGIVFSGKDTVKGLESDGGFLAGQEISASNGGIPPGTTILSCAPACGPEAETLTLSAAATKTSFSAEITGAPSATVGNLTTQSGAFAAEQEFLGPAVPPGTTVLSCAPACGPGATSLTLSAEPLASRAAAAIIGTSECTEAATKACTFAVSEQGEKLSGTFFSQFWGAAEDGSRAIFSTDNGDLYQFTVAGHETELIAHEAEGVMGASEDLGRVYFATREALATGPNPAGDEPVAGEPNLYLAEGAGRRFVGTLSDRDLLSRWRAISPEPFRRTAHVSPDGEVAAFTSSAALTGYDNTDAGSPVPCGQPEGRCDTEVFLYDAAGEGGKGKIACVSCNPGGGRPHGRLQPKNVLDVWAAGWLPRWQNSLYAGRPLSADGRRVFFEAADALVGRDANGAPDLYQWEAPGKGSCSEASPAYSPANAGCIGLISSGQGEGGATFLDASATGEDVFFTTVGSLAGGDYGLVDVYDARAGGGLPTPPAPPPECEGEQCQSPALAPEAAPPASLGYRGPGNAATSGSPARRCARAARRARRLARRAKRARRGAGRLARSNPRRAGALRRKAARGAKAARRQSKRARRCRARARKRAGFSRSAGPSQRSGR